MGLFDPANPTQPQKKLALIFSGILLPDIRSKVHTEVCYVTSGVFFFLSDDAILRRMRLEVET